MAQDTEKNLNVTELLEQTYSILCNRHNPQKIILPRRARAEIADDSDYHRTRTGYMAYKSVGLFKLNNKTWAITKGEAAGDYPADPYDSDITAIEFEPHNKTDEQMQKELYDSIQESSYFINSLIHSMSNGELATSKGKFCGCMSSILNSSIYEFIAQMPEYHPEYLSLSTLSPFCTRQTLYKNKFADFLANTIEKALL